MYTVRSHFAKVSGQVYKEYSKLYHRSFSRVTKADHNCDSSSIRDRQKMDIAAILTINGVVANQCRVGGASE
jgi:hypothetical protein